MRWQDIPVTIEPLRISLTANPLGLKPPLSKVLMEAKHSKLTSCSGLTVYFQAVYQYTAYQTKKLIFPSITLG